MQWRTIKKAPKYEVSENGDVRNKITGLVLRSSIDRYGYPKIHLILDDGGNYHATIHRLVAENWVDGWHPGLQVNHIDGNKKNNHWSNLEWVTVSENIQHSFEHRLNANTNPVKVVDVSSGKSKTFRSVKQTAKWLGMKATVLMPLIKGSSAAPIHGKYAVSLADPDRIGETANAVNFGKSIFVLDHLSGEVSEYRSRPAAAYHTGYRDISNIQNGPFTSKAFGYSFAYDRGDLPDWNRPSEAEAAEMGSERTRRRSIPYRRRNHAYFAFDYEVGKEHRFETLGGLVDFLNQNNPIGGVTNYNLSMALGDGAKGGRTGIFRGYGIRSDRHDFDWYPYSEEVLITSRMKLPAMPVYRITYPNGTKELVVGKASLCQRLGYTSSRNLSTISVEEIVESFGEPKLTVERLNRPMSNKLKI